MRVPDFQCSTGHRLHCAAVVQTTNQARVVLGVHPRDHAVGFREPAAVDPAEEAEGGTEPLDRPAQILQASAQSVAAHEGRRPFAPKETVVTPQVQEETKMLVHTPHPFVASPPVFGP